MTSALVLFSGGQDSATCLAWAAKNFDSVETIGFDYGQRHAIELEVRKDFLASFKRLDEEIGNRVGQDHFIDAKNLTRIGTQKRVTTDIFTPNNGFKEKGRLGLTNFGIGP